MRFLPSRLRAKVLNASPIAPLPCLPPRAARFRPFNNSHVKCKGGKGGGGGFGVGSSEQVMPRNVQGYLHL